MSHVPYYGEIPPDPRLEAQQVRPKNPASGEALVDEMLRDFRVSVSPDDERQHRFREDVISTIQTLRRVIIDQSEELDQARAAHAQAESDLQKSLGCSERLESQLKGALESERYWMDDAFFSKEALAKYRGRGFFARLFNREV